jgi:hypothetical protein
MTLPKGVKDAINNVSNSLSDTFIESDIVHEQAEAIRDHLLSQEAEIAMLRLLCGAMYQAAGAYDMPVRFLDALGDASVGKVGDRRRVESLLPCDVPDIHQRLAAADSLLRELKEDGNLYLLMRIQAHLQGGES